MSKRVMQLASAAMVLSLATSAALAGHAAGAAATSVRGAGTPAQVGKVLVVKVKAPVTANVAKMQRAPTAREGTATGYKK